MFASPLKLVEDISALGLLESFQLRLLACHALWLSPFFVRFCPLLSVIVTMDIVAAMLMLMSPANVAV